MTSAQAALPTALLDKMQKILVFELTATNLRGTLRQLTRKELLEEARAASLPEAVRAGGAPASDLLLLKARDVRKVDPVFGGGCRPQGAARRGAPALWPLPALADLHAYLLAYVPTCIRTCSR